MINAKTILAGTALLAAAGFATAETVTIDLAGIASNNGYGDAGNTVLNFDIGGGSQINSAYWTGVEGNTEGGAGASWGNEMRMAIGTDDFGAIGMAFFPAEGSGSAGGPWGPADGGHDFNDLGYTITTTDGNMSVEFYESYDDDASVADAFYTAGTVVIDYTVVPAPGALALLGLAGFAGRRRRRA